MKLLHLGDLHLGKKTHGRIESGLNSRLRDVQNRIKEIAEAQQDLGADLVLFAGDAFDTPTPTPTQQRLLVDALKDFTAPVVMIPGNHDHPITEGRSHAIDFLRELDKVTVLDEPCVKVVNYQYNITEEAPPQSLPKFVLAAMPWPLGQFAKGDEEDGLRARYTATIETASEKAEHLGVPAIGLGHFTIKGSLPSGSEKSLQMSKELTFSPEALSQLDFTALSHVHQHQEFTHDGNVVAAYSSSPERLSFGEEGEEKGFITFDPETPEDYTFHLTRPRAFTTIEEDLRETEDAEKALLEAIEEASVEDAIVRVRYRCREDQPLDERKVEEALEEAHAIAAIERQVERKREQRSESLPADSSLEDLMRAYVQSREGLEDIEEELVEEALAVQEKI
jgi:exonuclease SbcD